MKTGLRAFLLVGLLCFTSLLTYATHYRAGEIIYRLIGNYKYEAFVITYSKISYPSILADRNTIPIDWGDGTVDTIARINGPDLNSDGYPDGELIFADINKNVYRGVHTYPGPPPPPNRWFIISFEDQNRIDGILNIGGGGSVNVPFYVEDTLFYPTAVENIGYDSSPVLLNPPIDYANVNDTFFHNPAAYDPDGDSLDFELIACLQAKGSDVPLYVFPDSYCRSNNYPTNTFTIDRHTGFITWAVPCRVGIFNIAIMVREYREGILIGTLIRDMQIIVNSDPNDPPVLSPVRDTCVRAGETLAVNISATDKQTNQTVTLSAYGGPLSMTNSPANFNQFSGNPATGIFNWNTTCDHIQKQPYIVVFKASDDYFVPGPGGPIPAPLVDIETWQIHVIAPPVKNLTATATPQSVVLNWQNPYICAGSPDFRGFSVWRKLGCDSFLPDYCETGLDNRGYTKLTGANIFTYTYTDNTAVIGQQYSYRVLAHFGQLSPNGLFVFNQTASVPSDEVCVYMPIAVPVIINADVQQTDVNNGQLFVRWTKPLAGGNNLDTIQFPPPYRFELYRNQGFTIGGAATLVNSKTANSYTGITDTSYLDTNLDTKTTPWCYKLWFFSQNDTIGSTSPASSTFLTVNSSDQSLGLTWQEQVPWTNDSFSIFRLNNATSTFDSIGISYTHAYADTGLINDSTYCYYVKGYGHYTLTALPRPLINKSQEECGVPIDTVPPCPRALTVFNDCDQYAGQPWVGDQFINHLSWINQNDPCSSDIDRYYIYFGDDSTGMKLVDSITNRNDTIFDHILAESLAGCYAVTAVDRVGNQSAYSNIVCIDNCPYYILPNTFTPNGDGHNDVFHPFLPFRFVPKIEMHIMDRWGVEVYQTTDPMINWNGNDQKTGKPVSDGVYLYAGFYYEQHLGGLVKKPLSGDKKGGGVIHLIRGK
ncbi:MAG: gliding motility-associated C-terminal domain-containing protein [Chitinophagales bacterium]